MPRKSNHGRELSEQLTALAQPDAEIPAETYGAKKFNALLDRLSDPDLSLVGRLQREEHLTHYAGMHLYGGTDPKAAPVSDLKHLVCFTKPGDDNVDLQVKYRKRISGPLTGIRAFCVSCMNGQTALIKDCSAVTCALWPFRMGGNPFYGRIPDAEAESVETPDELAEDRPALSDTLGKE